MPKRSTMLENQITTAVASAAQTILIKDHDYPYNDAVQGTESTDWLIWRIAQGVSIQVIDAVGDFEDENSADLIGDFNLETTVDLFARGIAQLVVDHRLLRTYY